jgi:2-haloacid dehalogenase
MVHADDVRASIKVCMFDQYGTVVDMQTGLTEAATPFLAAKGWQGDPNSFVTWWRRTHFENSMIDALLWPSLCRFRPGARRYFLHARRSA